MEQKTRVFFQIYVQEFHLLLLYGISYLYQADYALEVNVRDLLLS